MFEWNNPYVLAVLLGLVAAGYNYVEQKQKNQEVDLANCGKNFALVTGLVLAFHYLVTNGAVPAVQSGGTGLTTVNLNDLKIKPGLPNF